VTAETKSGDEAEKVSAAQKDASAFEQLYLDYADQVFRYLYSQVGQRVEAEDLASQTFLSALEALPRYRHRGHFAAWLFSIARNKAMDYFRQQKPQFSLDEVEENYLGTDQPSDQYENARIEKLTKRIANLAEDQRELLRLRYVAELRFSEIAVILDRNTDAVKKSFYRLCMRLQAEMEETND
jgi:RNA polymerase sigma-70 factor (ECF subfamily)